MAGAAEADPVIGVGSAATSMAEVRRSLLEAQQVADAAAQAPSAAPVQPFYKLADLRLRGLLHLLAGDARLATFVDRELGPLLAYDAARGTDLTGVLAAYLAAGGNKAEAATRTQLARPTLYDRLRHIERILGVSLGSAGSRASPHLPPPAPPPPPPRAPLKPAAAAAGLRPRPGLVGRSGAAPDLHLGARGSRPAGVVEALAGLRVEQRPVRLRLPYLRTGAVAGVKVHERSVRRAAGHVEAAAVRVDGAVRLFRPLLAVGAVAGVDLDLGAVGVAVTGHVQAQPAVPDQRRGHDA